LSYVEIEFDDRILALILLASLLNIWEAIRMVVSNSIEKSKLKYDDIRDLILEKKKVQKKDANENSTSNAFLYLKTRGKRSIRS
jgi:hypothetical protein